MSPVPYPKLGRHLFNHIRLAFSCCALLAVMSCDNATESKASFADRPLNLSMVILEDDLTPDFTWGQEVLHHQIGVSGKSHDAGGAGVDAQFGTSFNQMYCKLRLTVEVIEEELLRIHGEYESKRPLTLTLRGTGATDDQDFRMTHPAGTGVIEFTGPLHFTYKKEITPPTPAE